MTNYYSNSADYHDDLDRYEARVRAEQAEREFFEQQAQGNPKLDAVAIYDAEYERTGDYNAAAAAVEAALQPEFGSTEWFELIEEIPF